MTSSQQDSSCVWHWAQQVHEYLYSAHKTKHSCAFEHLSIVFELLH